MIILYKLIDEIEKRIFPNSNKYVSLSLLYFFVGQFGLDLILSNSDEIS